MTEEVLHGDPKSDDDPKPKQNRGNRRRGAVKGTHSGLRRGQLPWRKDPMIVSRVNLVRRLIADGASANEMIDEINEAMAKQFNAEPITVYTVYDDYERVKELQREERNSAKGVEEESLNQKLENLRRLKRKAHKAFDETPDKSLNRSSYISSISKIEMDEAKLLGLLDKKVTAEDEEGYRFTFKIDTGKRKSEGVD